MNKLALVLSLVLVLGFGACAEPSSFSPPAAPDGREVKLIVGPPGGTLEVIYGTLLQWDSDWISVRQRDGQLSHFATHVVASVHEIERR